MLPFELSFFIQCPFSSVKRFENKTKISLMHNFFVKYHIFGYVIYTGNFIKNALNLILNAFKDNRISFFYCIGLISYYNAFKTIFDAMYAPVI